MTSEHPEPRFIVAAGRLSYKRHGRNGSTWFVIDTEKHTSVARADDRNIAQAQADRLNESAHR